MTIRTFLETGRLRLGYFSETDATRLWELNRDPAVMRYINGGIPLDYDPIKNETIPHYLAYYTKYEHYGLWPAIEKSSGEFIGWFLFLPAAESTFAFKLNLAAPNEIEIGYRLKQSAWGKGYATEGAQAIVKKAFTEWGVERIVAWALAANTASRRVLEKTGLKFDRELPIPSHLIPQLPPEELTIVKYALNQQDFSLSSSSQK